MKLGSPSLVVWFFAVFGGIAMNVPPCGITPSPPPPGVGVRIPRNKTSRLEPLNRGLAPHASQSGAKVARTPNAGARYQGARLARSVWSAGGFSAAFTAPERSSAYWFMGRGTRVLPKPVVMARARRPPLPMNLPKDSGKTKMGNLFFVLLKSLGPSSARFTGSRRQSFRGILTLTLSPSEGEKESCRVLPIAFGSIEKSEKTVVLTCMHEDH